VCVDVCRRNLYKLDGCVVYFLFGPAYHLLATVERLQVAVRLVDLVSALVEQRDDTGLVFDDRLRELSDLMVLVLVECTQDTDASVARLAVEPDGLVAVFTAFDVFLDLDVEHRMSARHLANKQEAT
jgi:hypothetical protein